jgi:hypothetical protein
LIDDGNILNSEFATSSTTIDAIGLGMSKKKLMKFNLAETKLSGIICSTNNMEGLIKPLSSKL